MVIYCKHMEENPGFGFDYFNAESDIMNTYDLGVNSYIQKPVGFSELAEIAKSVVDYWFKTVTLPLKLY